MNIHEYQAKEILREYGAPVSRGIVVFSLNEIRDKISKLNKMHEDGVITQEEFQKAKEKILK